jgi:hypothetical protein
MAMYGCQQIPKNSVNRLEAMIEPPPGLKPMEMTKCDYQEMQKQAYEEQKLDKRVKRVEALMDCVKDLGVLEKSMDSLSERLGVSVEGSAHSRPTRNKPITKQVERLVEPKKATAAAQTESEWFKKESKSHSGRFYWVNRKTGQTTWKKPEDWKEPGSETESAPAPKKTISLLDKLSISDAEASTDAGYTSVSDYDSDDLAMRSRSSQRSGFRVDAPVFKPSSPTSPVFRVDAPVFQPTSSIEIKRETLLGHRLFVVGKDVLSRSTKPGDIVMKSNADITYPPTYF